MGLAATRWLLRMLRLIGWLPVVAVALALVQAGEGVYRSGVAYGFIDPTRLAEYRLYAASTARYEDEIRSAIAARDYAYAQSLYDLGVANGRELSPQLREAAEATWARRLYASGTRAAEGFVFGTVDSGEEIAGSLASDLIGVGDVRDFSVQGFNYMAGRDYDPFLLGFAAVGLGLTAASYTSFGLSAAPDAGISLLKNAYRGRKLSRPLAAYFEKSAMKVVDPAVLRRELQATTRTGLPDAAGLTRVAERSVDKVAARSLVDDLQVLDSMRKRGGLRSSMAALAVADGPKDLRKLERITQRFGETSYAVMKFLGKSAIRVGHVFVEIIQALVSLVLLIITTILRWPLKFVGRVLLRHLVGAEFAAAIVRPLAKLF